MKKLTGYISLAVILGLLIYDTSFLLKDNKAQTSIRAPQSTKMASIVRLLRPGGATFCTGTVITPTTILTAAHCVSQEVAPGFVMMNRDPIEIRLDDNLPIGVLATPYGVRVQFDQALLQGDFSKFKPRKFTADIKELILAAHSSEGFVSCGYPMGGHLFCTSMLFKNYEGFMWAASGVLIPGMSGGPTLASDGSVVATNVAVEKDFSVISPVYNLDQDIK